MEKIIKFYELNENDLVTYNKDTIDKLYKIIIDSKNKLKNEDLFNKCLMTIEECNEIFSIMNVNYMYYVDEYILKLKNCLLNNFEIENNNNTNKYIIRKTKLYIQLLEYLKIINYDGKVFFDVDKYNIVIDTYNIFFNLKPDIKKCHVEWYSNNYIFFCSKSTIYKNICIYYLDDLFGFRIFLTFKKNKLDNKIKLCVFDSIIKSEKDFYKKIERLNNYSMHYINIKKIAKCFSINLNIDKSYSESNFVDENKMLKYVNIFLNE
jgi:hypothetical protein